MALPEPKQFTADLQAAIDRGGDASFKSWIWRPEVKLMVSLIPPAQPPELVATLLRAAFDQGCSHGHGTTLIHLTQTFLRDTKTKD